MTTHTLPNMLGLIRASALIEQRISGGLSSVHGLAPREAFLMMHLENAPNSRLTRIELSRRLHVSASTVTRMAAPLEKIGLIDRETDERDARLVFVVLTKAGENRIQEVRNTLAQQAEALFQDRWNEEELELFSQLLGRLIAHAPGSLE